MAERKAVTKQMAGRYAKASKKDKGKMLDELCALTGWTRRHARRALAQAIRPSQRPPRPPRPKIYGPEVVEPLRVIWATLNGPAGKRLAPFMPQIVDALERCGEIRIKPESGTSCCGSPLRRSIGSLLRSAAGCRCADDRAPSPGAC